MDVEDIVEDRPAVESLLDRALQTAAARDLDISRTRAETDRFGPVELYLHTQRGHIAVKEYEPGNFHLTVWAFNELAAWRRTSDLAEVVEALHLWKKRSTPAELKDALPELTMAAEAGEAATIEAQWQWLFALDAPSLRDPATAAYAVPALRALYPFTSTTSFSLLNGPALHSTRSMMFLILGDGACLVTGRDISISAPSLGEAIAQAAAAVAEWPHRAAEAADDTAPIPRRV
jgi:hypothetical protein